MKTYRIKYNYSRASGGHSVARAFGERNEGILVEAENEAAAVETFNAPRLLGARFNPFYLKIEEVKP